MTNESDKKTDGGKDPLTGMTKEETEQNIQRWTGDTGKISRAFYINEAANREGDDKSGDKPRSR